jgi:hypothetical protein
MSAYRSGRGPLDLTGEARARYAALDRATRLEIQAAAKAALETEAAPQRAAEEKAARERRERLALMREEESKEDLLGLIEHVQSCYAPELDAARIGRTLADYGLRLEVSRDGYEVAGDIGAAIARVTPNLSARRAEDLARARAVKPHPYALEGDGFR